MSSTTAATNASSKRKRKPEETKVKATRQPEKGQESSAKEPYLVYMTALGNFSDGHGFLGPMLVKGIPGADDSGDQTDSSEYTKKQMEGLRFIFINQSRNDKIDEMRDLILGDQAGSSCMMFDTSFSYNVSNSWETVKRKISRTKNPAQKLDLLIAFTHTVKEFDVWMHDNEGGMGSMVESLAGAWKRVLKMSDDDLGWDTEYTKPGVMELLKQFQKEIDSMDSCYEVGKFKYI